jgi:hypothetical protein
MSQQNMKRQHLELQDDKQNENGNELGEPEFKMLKVQQQPLNPILISGIFTINFQAKNGVLSAVDLANANEENGALGEKLKEAEEKAQMLNNEVKNTHIPIFIKRNRKLNRNRLIATGDCRFRWS